MLLLLSLLFGAAGRVSAQTPPPTPCPEVFQYWYQNGQWSGHVIVPIEDGVDEVTVVTSLFVSDVVPPVPGGLHPTADINGVYRNVNAGWKNNPSIEYKLIFPVQSPLPLLDKITVNNDTICQGIPAKVRYTTESTCRARLRGQGQGSQMGGPFGHCSFHRTVWKTLGAPTHTPATKQTAAVSGDHAGKLPPPTPATTTDSDARVSCADSLQHQKTKKNVTCGIPLGAVHTIYNGMNTRKGDWPWLVALYYKTAMQLLCGGSLISSRHVITAAHCFKDTRRLRRIVERDVLILLGKFDLSNWNEPDVQCRQPERIIIHPDYRDVPIKNDIAVLYLEKRVKFNVFVIPICLFRRDMETPVSQTTGTVVGWGKEEIAMKVSDRPLVAMVPIVSQETCTSSNEQFQYYVNERTLCAGDRNGTGPCSGDSGGGLVVQIREPDRKIRWYLRGIISFNLKGLEDVCHLNEYSVYTDVSRYGHWLENVVRRGRNDD